MRSSRCAAALFLMVQPALWSQPEPRMPAWLQPYPGATVQTTTAKSLVESSYTAAAKPEAVIDHYRKLFEAENLPFVPNFDGMGTVVRAAAAECDLMVSIRAANPGSSVRVDCSGGPAPSTTWSAVPDANPGIPGRAGSRAVARPVSPRLAWDEESHKQRVKELNIHPVYQDAPAPPLVWPAWLVHINGRKLATQAGVDRASHEYLKSTYVTSEPMTALHLFYGDLLKANGYPVHSSELSTGQTISGIVQNANGHVEGHNYPNGHPGPYTEIHVSYRRSHLNDPITVELKFTTYAFKAPPPFDP